MMRLPGLASGMDTESMVKQLMKAEQIKVDRVKQDKQILEWKRQLYNDINKDFANFILKVRKDFGYSSVTGRPGSMDWIKKAVSSDEKVATVTAKGSGIEGNHSITVNRLADGVKGGSNAIIELSQRFSEGKFEINGKEISISQDETITDVVKKINETEEIGVSASYDPITKRFFIQSHSTGEADGSIKLKALDGGGEKFLKDLDLSLSHYNNGVLESSRVAFAAGDGEKEFKGISAEIIYNGITIKQNNNVFELNGMNISLNGTGSFNVNITTDTDGVIDKIKTFIEDYNNMLEKANDLTREKANRNYKPLTEEQKEAMTEKEIELWEAKAKSGIIRKDMDIENMLSSIRLDIYKNVEGVTGPFKNITEIGITTQKYKSGSGGGKLQLDEEKLKKALSKDPEAVLELLFKEDKKNAITDDSDLSASELASKRQNSGIMTRIFDNMVVGMKGLIAKSGPGDEGNLFREVKATMLTDFAVNGGRFSKKGSISDLEDEILKYDKKLDDLEKYLFRKENDYYAKFTAMEKAMQRMSSQSGWLSQQLGGN